MGPVVPGTEWPRPTQLCCHHGLPSVPVSTSMAAYMGWLREGVWSYAVLSPTVAASGPHPAGGGAVKPPAGPGAGPSKHLCTRAR